MGHGEEQREGEASVSESDSWRIQERPKNLHAAERRVERFFFGDIEKALLSDSCVGGRIFGVSWLAAALPDPSSLFTWPPARPCPWDGLQISLFIKIVVLWD